MGVAYNARIMELVIIEESCNIRKFSGKKGKCHTFLRKQSK